MKTVKCKSGIRGWQAKLHEVYDSLEEFRSYAELRGIHIRLGFKNIKRCWNANPIMRGSVNPSDLMRVPEPKPKTCKKCGTPLNSRGRCKDQTCVYSDHPQSADLGVLYGPGENH